MSSLKKQLVEHFRLANSAPFLFIGSGFSRRYLGLDDWKGLLSKFSQGLRDFDYYLSTANGLLPEVAELMSHDFHDIWWSADKYSESREKHKGKVRDKTSALRIEICSYLASISQIDISKSEYKNEIELLSKLNVDGIITTNWDTFLESLFPEYKVFVGQGELLFSHPQSIAEIYKIHGSVTKPSSLVLTSNDYSDFENKNPYLAAKLITLFVEHPIVFIGYSLSDPNICALLRSIVYVLGKDNIEKLRNNLIFIQRKKNDHDSELSQTFLTIDGGQIPITVVHTNSFVPVYEALDEVKRKIPARVLRYCKEQLYELVKSNDPEAKLCVVDIDDIENKGDIEFVVGVGVAAERASLIGYQPITLLDLFKDSLQENSEYDPNMIINHTLPLLAKSATYIPIYKYIKLAGLSYKDARFKISPDLSRQLFEDTSPYKSKTYTKPFLKNGKEKSAIDIIQSNTPEKAAAYLAFLPKELFNTSAIKDFLNMHIDKLDANSSSSYSTYFRKLACLLDWYMYRTEE